MKVTGKFILYIDNRNEYDGKINYLASNGNNPVFLFHFFNKRRVFQTKYKRVCSGHTFKMHTIKANLAF